MKDSSQGSGRQPRQKNPRAPKGAPTPTRRAQEGERKRPLVPRDREAAKKAAKEARRQEQLRMRKALNTGDERYLPIRDRGPQRRRVRDLVDVRTGLGEFLMFIAFAIVLVTAFLPNASQAYSLLFLGFWVLVFLVIIESFVLGRRIRKALNVTFPEIERGVVWYGIMRSLQFRKLRLPKPQVKRGERP